MNNFHPKVSFRAVTFFLGARLAYLPVVTPVISLILRYVPIGRVEDRKEKDRANRDRRSDRRCYFSNAPFSSSIFISNSLPPSAKSPTILLSPNRSSFLLMSKILNLSATSAARVRNELSTWDGRPANMNDTHSLKWPQFGIRPHHFGRYSHPKWPPG